MGADRRTTSRRVSIGGSAVHAPVGPYAGRMTSSSPERPRVGTRGVPRPVREAQILEVAGQVFATEGYAGASMDAIAARADVSKPMLYNYFGSKRDLYFAYIEQAGKGLREQMRRAAGDDQPAEERLWAGILAFFRFVDDHRAGWAVLYQEAASQGGPFAAEVADLRSRIAQTVAQLFRQATEEKVSRTGSSAVADSFAHALVGAGESLANWWLHHPDVELEDAARRLMNFAWMGLDDLIDGETWSPPSDR